MSEAKVRIDKWLWAVRIFKTRSISTDNIRSGKVSINKEHIKASYHVKTGDVYTVRKNGFDFQYQVLEIIDKRVNAQIAATCYKDLTPAEELQKFESWYLAGKKGEFREKGTGRPTKKDRREIDDFKDFG
ncbi:MAG TPA: RNA-binding S4 domain-containing protein [Saprospiraceae bacterium]|nr:RNA-binding S4 domain-containing protein [Saprospiraceae bacterium]MCC6689796.1 RNA-binding S4 domain-containing protein [Saprospiraceae bacterium]HMV25201.1 RNA-binding S4 domain-containing protein [Saprospiraceae bacterium]HMW76109.1 RNA-binding S4 domain-containing protein [Saprospiraceae bacterium]HMX83022.1 RNA-binding S4 domain-containing protein [Saprospiraceae bacterium]